MILRVGPFLYRVHFVEVEIIHEGERCLGLCDNETHDIYVAANTSFAQQIQIICHEYMEAWLYHFGQPEPDKEAYCDLFGMAMAQFVMDFIRQLDRVAAEAGEPGLGDRRMEGGNLISRVELREAASLPQPRRTSSRSSSSAAPRRSAPSGQRELIATKLAQAARSAGLRVRQPPPPHNSGP